MTAPVSLAEVAAVNSTGHRVTVLRRASHVPMTNRSCTRSSWPGILSLAPHRVSATAAPGSAGSPVPTPDTVFMIDDQGRATAALPGAYFQAHYTVIQT